mgnify:CR=1 FL=1
MIDDETVCSLCGVEYGEEEFFCTRCGQTYCYNCVHFRKWGPICKVCEPPKKEKNDQG